MIIQYIDDMWHILFIYKIITGDILNVSTGLAINYIRKCRKISKKVKKQNGGITIKERINIFKITRSTK